VLPGAPALELARRIADTRGLVLRGVQGYHGAIQQIVDFRRREAEARAAVGRLRETVDLIRADGLPVDIVSAGGTGTFPIDSVTGGLTEVQPGSYVFMDTTYSAIQWSAAGDPPPFARALTILGTVVSRPARDRAVIDVGWKAASSDSGPPVPLRLPGARFDFGGDEHGILRFDGPGPLDLGARVELYPSHCDTTVNLYDHYVGVRDGVVEAVWPIPGRGRSR
jgi:3-hydroxy-D-aspartate aldolase